MIKYIRILSDCHMEFLGMQLPILETDSETLLVLAGDIDVKTKVIPFLKDMATRFPLVAYVLGNHEHYRSSIDVTGVKIKKAIEQEGLTNVHLLENEVLEINGYRILGGTMWSDINRGDPISMWTCQQSINDYKYIRHSNYGRKFHPNVCITEHLKFKSFLQQELAKDYDGQYIIVTHHAPHDLSIDPSYKNEYHLNGQYRSDLSELILDNPKIKMWIHGHIHCNSKYQIGDCTVICNPRGYAPNWLNEGFDPNFVLEL